MFIQTEDTPNPNTVKFIPGREVAKSVTEFKDRENSSNNQLAAMIFENEGTESILLGYDFISVTKKDTADWYNLRPIVLGTIMEYFSKEDAKGNTNNNLNKEKEQSSINNSNHQEIDLESLSAIEKEIYELIETRVRPAVAMDGGDIVFKNFEDGIVFLQMKGACSGCPSSTATLKVGIENMLKHYIPEVLEVRAVA